MDNFIKLGKEFLESRSNDNVSQQSSGGGGGGYGVQGGPQYNSPDNRPPAGYQGGGGQQFGGQGYQDNQQQGHGGGQGYGSGQGYGGGQGYPSASGGGGRPQFDEDEVVKHAEQEGSGDRSLFTTAMGFLGSHQDEHERPLNEEHVTSAHQQAYSGGGPSGMSASSMGSAAALEVLKKFTGGGSSGGGSGGSKSQLISLAMAEATKLFDGAGGAASGNKQDAVNSAAMTVMKLLVQSKVSGTVGGKDSGGLSGLMGMASQFLK